MAKYRRTFSSGGKQTSSANQVIDFYQDSYPYGNCNVQFLQFTTYATPISIKLNDETTVHWIDANSEFVISDIDIDKITILNASAEYYYTAMTAE
ncbi:hypothetical protein V7128_01375 [Neobacillus vireti]|uniref:hypothetical protein n=1 Tax=Neobacillus vireti TaxID=220686 RepID=UPI003000852B